MVLDLVSMPLLKLIILASLIPVLSLVSMPLLKLIILASLILVMCLVSMPLLKLSNPVSISWRSPTL